MEFKTSVASGIDAARDKAEYDSVCKRLLSEKIILAWIMKSCVEEFRGSDVNEIAEKYIEGKPFVSEVPVSPDETAPVIQGIAQGQDSPAEGSVYFDIYFNAIAPGTDKPIQLIINVEAQADFYPGYPLLKRAIFYCCRIISAQYGTVFDKSHYEKLRKVYSVWICVNPPKSRRNTINVYRIMEENIAGSVREDARDYDLLSVVVVCLDGEGGAGEGCEGILKMLGVLLSPDVAPAEKKQILQEEFQIPMTQTMEREAAFMYSIGQSIEDRALKKGIMQGRAQGLEQGVRQGLEQGVRQGLEQGVRQGLEQGRAEGRDIERLNSIRMIMKNTGATAERAMEILGIDGNSMRKYQALLQ